MIRVPLRSFADSIKQSSGYNQTTTVSVFSLILFQKNNTAAFNFWSSSHFPLIFFPLFFVFLINNLKNEPHVCKSNPGG